MPDPVAPLNSLENLGNIVPAGYAFHDKQAAPGPDLDLPGARLKWYNLQPAEAPIADAESAQARSYLTSQANRLGLAGELGFVILHRAGQYLLLILNVWRNTNEIWESAYFLDPSQSGGYQPFEFSTRLRATFCVWELSIVWHERGAWVRFIRSARDAAAKQAYLDDRYVGLA